MKIKQDHFNFREIYIRITKIRQFFKVVFLLVSLISFSQGKNERSNLCENEIKFNAGSFLFEFPEIGYEYLLNNESAVAMSLAFPINKSISYRFMAYPYYRFYFGENRAAGFFFEGNSAIFSQRHEGENFMGLGAGIAIGKKFLSKNGFICDIYLGGGRNFINKDEIGEGYPRIGVSIGKRF